MATGKFAGTGSLLADFSGASLTQPLKPRDNEPSLRIFYFAKAGTILQ